MQVESCLHGRSAEDDGASLLEQEFLADDLLQGEPVGAAVHVVGAIHLETAIIMVGGAYAAVAVEGDIILGTGIHE